MKKIVSVLAIMMMVMGCGITMTCILTSSPAYQVVAADGTPTPTPSWYVYMSVIAKDYDPYLAPPIIPPGEYEHLHLAKNNHYTATGKITVHGDMHIAEGVELKFTAPGGLYVEGQLASIGTAESPVLIRWTDSDNFNQLHINDLKLEHTTVRLHSHFIVQTISTQIEHSKFDYIQIITVTENARFSHNDIGSELTNRAIEILNLYGTMAHNDIHDITRNNSYIVYLKMHYPAEVYNNKFRHNHLGTVLPGFNTPVILISATSLDEDHYPRFYHNNTYNNTERAGGVVPLYREASWLMKNADPGDVIATENFWGTTDADNVGNRLYDKDDDWDLGEIHYVPIAQEPFQEG